MRIQIASDLHLEFLQRNFPGERLIAPAHGADLLVLAGDIGNGTLAVELFGDWPVPVLYVAGNHEYYGHDMEQLRADLRAATCRTSMRFLDNDIVDFWGIRFIGTTLWTDYRLTLNRLQSELMDVAERRISDHHRIWFRGRALTARDALAEHESSRAWLERALDTQYAGRTVVISHHGPHPLSVHPRYAGDPLNAAFVSDLSEQVVKADLWIHGHVHDFFDYAVGQCRVVANPRGYVQNQNSSPKAHALQFENSRFDWACVIDMPPV